MIVAKALFGTESSSAYKTVSAIETGEVRVAVSDDSLRELNRVVQYDNVREKLASPVLALNIGLYIGVMGYFFMPERYEWPSMGDRKDWWVLDLAFESGADYIVTDDKHFSGSERLGFEVISPSKLLKSISEESSD